MNEEIRKHVAKYNEDNGWDASDEGIVDTILEAGKHVWTGNESGRRWWTDCFTVVDVNGMLIGYDNAITTGDDSPADKGWEFDPESICQVKSKVIEVTVYEKDEQ